VQRLVTGDIVISAPDGRALNLWREAGSIHVVGIRPLATTGGDHHITTGHTDPERIAHQITTRLLPDYHPDHARGMEQLTARREAQVGVDAAVRDVARIVPGAAVVGTVVTWAKSYPGMGHGKVHVWADRGGQVRVDMSITGLSVEAAQAALDALVGGAR
jgi:hypothetical protein